MRSILPAVSFCLLLCVGCATTTTERLGLPPLKVVKQRVDLERLAGTWYEIARFPHQFQRQCAATTMTYKQRPDGDLTMLYSCRVGNAVEGRLREARGQVRVVDKDSNAKLEVLTGPFAGPAWIVDLDPQYRYVVIGEPGRDYVWILGRATTLPDETLEAIVKHLAQKGYEVTRLKTTAHAPNADEV